LTKENILTLHAALTKMLCQGVVVKAGTKWNQFLGHMPTVKVIFQHLQPISTTVPYKKLTLDLGFFLQTLIA